MKATTVSAGGREAVESRPVSRLQQWSRRLLFSKLARLKECELTVVEGGERWVFGAAPGATPLRATVSVLDPSFYGAVIGGGSVGAGEAYMDGLWSADDLNALVRIFVRNLSLLDDMEGGFAALSAPARKLFHLLNRNTRSGSRRNIAAHYDLGNELFALFLDRNLMYSSAVYERSDMSLEQASEAKLDRICRKLELNAGDRVLEIGTGWGGFALYAAERYGCQVTTTTISREQCELARRRVLEAGLGDRITVLLEDYRDLVGRYDKLVSIEMIEAIGHRYMPRFFDTASRLLDDRGMMLLQAITIDDRRYRRALGSVDFIQRYIFPGSFLPSVSAITDAVARASDLRVFHLEDIGPHYALTLREWRRRFLERVERVKSLGYPPEFVRMWEFYLCYCEGAFEERALGDVQVLLTKPGCRRQPVVPALRD